jgi:phospholipase C
MSWSFVKLMPMTTYDLTRRSLLGATTATALFHSTLARALATSASRRSGTIMDVEHVVVLMLENRSFDHYFGTMRGVRGFADPHPVSLPQGRPVWQQADAKGGIITPFAIDMARTNFPVLKSLDHHWGTGHDAWNQGRYDRWVQAKGGLTMGHLNRSDLPYHYALADAFTVCDSYFCSVQGPTCPNRLYLMTGNVDHSNAGGHGPVIDNIDITQRPDGVVFGAGWQTYAEALQDAGVSWQLYRQGDDNSDDASDGGMDTLLAFERFRAAKPGDPLYERGVRPRRAGATEERRAGGADRAGILDRATKAVLRTPELAAILWCALSCSRHGCADRQSGRLEQDRVPRHV